MSTAEQVVTGPGKRVPVLTLDELRDRPTVSVEEAGAVLSLGRGSAYAAVKRGEIPGIRLGRRIVVPSSALLRMLDAETVA
jgi:excisionase family DNA binding protein